MSEVQCADNTSLMSCWIQMDCLWISDGTYASLELIHTYTTFGLSSVICQNGYLMIPGVLYSTPASRNRFSVSVAIQKGFVLLDRFTSAFILDKNLILCDLMDGTKRFG